MQLKVYGSIFPYLLILKERRKTIRSELELNPGPLASQAKKGLDEHEEGGIVRRIPQALK